LDKGHAFLSDDPEELKKQVCELEFKIGRLTDRLRRSEKAYNRMYEKNELITEMMYDVMESKDMFEFLEAYKKIILFVAKDSGDTCGTDTVP